MILFEPRLALGRPVFGETPKIRSAQIIYFQNIP